MTEKTKFISIKVKLLGIILPVMILIMTVLTGLFYYVSKTVIQSDAHNLLQTSVESQAAEMEAWLNQNLVSASLAKQAVEQMGFDDKQLQDFLDSYYNYDSNYSEGFYIAGTDGTLLRANPVRAVELREPDAEGNYLNNGSFAVKESLTDDKDWIFLLALEGQAEAQFEENEVFIDIANEGTVDYSVQFVQPNVPLKKDAVYTVRFDASAEEDRTIKVSVTAPDRDYRAKDFLHHRHAQKRGKKHSGKIQTQPSGIRHNLLASPRENDSPESAHMSPEAMSNWRTAPPCHSGTACLSPSCPPL